VVLTFEVEPRWGKDKHPHEAPLTMTVPLIILAVLSVAGGIAGIPASLGGGNAIEHWLEPVFRPALDKLGGTGHEDHTMELVLMAVSVSVALSGVWLARRWYLRKKEIPEALTARMPGIYRLLWSKYYVDEAYDATIVTPLQKGSEKLLWKVVDVGVIDWLVNGSARAVGFVSRGLRLLQTGAAQSYVVVFILGVVAILGWLLVH